MNIFKVLASSKKTFPEEQASVMLAWLLNPYMEHGLGFIFLNKFLAKIDSQTGIVHHLKNDLQPVLRSERQSNKLEFSADIEFYVDKSFIDIIIFINKNIISIENKIYSSSASNKEQLKLQYNGLTNKYKGDGYKLFMIFLVPNKTDSLAVAEYDELKVENPDNKIILEWNDICDIIHEILMEEQQCKISPLNEYLRHTLKAFSSFINDDFNGYYVETTKSASGMNPLAKGRKTLSEIHSDDSITFVGVQYDIMGLLSLGKDEINSKSFQITSESMDNKTNWIKRDKFLKICDSIENDFNRIDWMDADNIKLPSHILYKIAKQTKEQFYIGIQGGTKALSTMDNAMITNKIWGVSLLQKTGQWIEKQDFCKIICDKGVDFACI